MAGLFSFSSMVSPADESLVLFSGIRFSSFARQPLMSCSLRVTLAANIKAIKGGFPRRTLLGDS